MMRPLYCDESIWIPVADGLRRRGWEVHTARSEDTLGDLDREQLGYAAEKDWILVTFDDDFLSLVEGEGLEHAGLIYVRQAGRRIGDVVKAVDAHLEEREAEDRSIRHLEHQMVPRPAGIEQSSFEGTTLPMSLGTQSPVREMGPVGFEPATTRL
ncbi:MAG: DUF5615 family PIN-like protein [Salinigranum sp.]